MNVVAGKIGGWISLARHRLFSSSTAPYWAFIALSTFIATVNVGGPYILRFIDIAWPVEPVSSLLNLRYAWIPLDQGSLNYLNNLNLVPLLWISGLSLLGLPIYIQEILTLAILLAIATSFFYKITKEFVLPPEQTTWKEGLAFAAGLLCVNNYVVLVVYWWDNVPGAFFMMAFGSALVYFGLKLTNEVTRTGRPRFRSTIWFAVLAPLALSINIPFNLSILVLLLVLPLCVGIRQSWNILYAKRLAISYGIQWTIVFTTNAWWIYSSYLASTRISVSPSSPGVQSFNLSVFHQTTSSNTLLYLWQSIYPYSSVPVAYSGPVGLLLADIVAPLSVTLLICAVLGLLVRERADRIAVASLLVPTLLLMLVISGEQSPVYPFLAWAVSNSLVLEALRNPVVALGFAYFALLTLCSIRGADGLFRELGSQSKSVDLMQTSSVPPARRTRFSRARRQLPVALVMTFTLTATLLAMPIYTGTAVPAYPYEARVVIPAYEFDVANYIKTNLDGEYGLLYPGGYQEQNWTHGYDAYDILPSLLPQSFLIYSSQEGFTAADNPLLDSVYSTLAAGDAQGTNFSALLGRLSVKFIVIEGDLGGYYPIGSIIPPNYPMILSSLNESPGIDLATQIGPDYIYVIESPEPVVRLASSSVDSSNLIDGSIQPTINFTELYYNLSAAYSSAAPFNDIAAKWRSGIQVALNQSVKSDLANLTLAPPLGPSGPPTYFNALPLTINWTPSDYLILNFTTNLYTAITIALVTAPTLTGLNSTQLAENTHVVGGADNNLGYGDPALFGSYGADHFYSPNEPSTMAINLGTALSPQPGASLHYILFSFFPVSAQGSGLPGLPVNEWPETQSLSVTSLSVGEYVFSTSRSPDETSIGVNLPNAGQNLTRQFFNMALANSSLPNDISPNWNNSIQIGLNASAKLYIQSHPLGSPLGPNGPPTLFNAVPFTIDARAEPLLSVAFRTNQYCALAIAVSTAENLSSLDSTEFQSTLYYLGGTASNVGIGTPSLVPSFGAFHYDSPNSSTLLVENLAELLSGVTTPVIHYLLFTVFPVSGNGSGIRGLPVSEWPNNQNFTVEDISLSGSAISGNGTPAFGDGYYRAVSLVRNSSLVQLEPSQYLLNSSIGELDSNATVSFENPTPVEWEVQLRLESESNRHPLLLILEETYFSGWVIEPRDGVSNWSHVRVDGSVNGFIVWPTPGAISLAFSLYFAGQSAYQTSWQLGLLVPGVLLATAVWVIVGRIRSKRVRKT